MRIFCRDSRHLRSSRRAAGRVFRSTGELYLWAGTTLQYRFYSSLLQGQFRESFFTLGSDAVERLFAHAWLGATREFADNVRGSFFYRASSKELQGPNAHYQVWAGLIISRAY